MGLYEFKEQDAWDFARYINIEAKPSGEELVFKTCPFCNPKPTKDNVKTFSINLRTGQFHCFRASCMKSGNMIDIAKHFGFSLGRTVDEYLNPQRQYKTYPKPKKKPEPKPPVTKYLTGRGISEEVINRYQIGSKRDDDRIIAFTFMNENGGIDFIKYRRTDFDKTKHKNKEWSEEGMKPILYGMYQCNLENKTLIITEGQIDSLSVATAGFENAISVPTGATGFTWISYCWDWINKFEEIIVFGDHEKGHITLLDELKYRLEIKVKHVREEDYRDCKDANEILLKYGKNQIKTCIENAISPPIKYVRNLADVKPLDIYSVEKLGTGIKELNKLLYGGLPFPGVVVITGKAGEGKSTFASQIIAQALNQGYNCFVYSGELPNDYFKAWLNFQLAGQRNIYERNEIDGNIIYDISNVYVNQIEAWYNQRIFILDNMEIENDEFDGLLMITEKVIKQYGVRVLLMDNLMTALDLYISRERDKFEKQSRFTKKLARMALAFNVIIILVAHKRKNSYGDNEMDDVMGASDITNLATVTLSYGRGKHTDESQRELKLLKNRLFGKVDTDGWIMDFDEKSKRIYGAGDDVNVKYGWEKDTDDFVPTEETPFD